MKRATEQLLIQAREDFASGDKLYATAGEFYAKAADGIIAAMADEPLTWEQVAVKVKKSARQCRRLVDARRQNPTETSIVIDQGRGTHATKAEIEQGARRLLQTATHKQIANLMQDVTDEQRDEIVLGILGTEEDRQTQRDEVNRKQVASHPVHGWRPVIDAFGEANRGLVNALDALVKLVIHRGRTDEDPLNLARERAEMIGRSIYEIEMAWGETPITDKIEELRGQPVG